MKDAAEEDFGRLYESTVRIMRKMCEEGGRNVESDLFGVPGGYITQLSQKSLGEPCMKCGSLISRAFFNKFNPGCNEHLMVNRMREYPGYLKEFSRVAVADGHVVGTIMYFMAKVVAGDRETEVPSFGPLCADHRYKNCGIGSALLEKTVRSIFMEERV